MDNSNTIQDQIFFYYVTSNIKDIESTTFYYNVIHDLNSLPGSSKSITEV